MHPTLSSCSARHDKFGRTESGESLVDVNFSNYSRGKAAESIMNGSGHPVSDSPYSTERVFSPYVYSHSSPLSQPPYNSYTASSLQSRGQAGSISDTFPTPTPMLERWQGTGGRVGTQVDTTAPSARKAAKKVSVPALSVSEDVTERRRASSIGSRVRNISKSVKTAAEDELRYEVYGVRVE